MPAPLDIRLSAGFVTTVNLKYGNIDKDTSVKFECTAQQHAGGLCGENLRVNAGLIPIASV